MMCFLDAGLIIANCYRAGINAEVCLAELFERLPTTTKRTVSQLTPHAVAAKRRADLQAATAELAGRTTVTT